MTKNLILASASPRRKTLLAKIGVVPSQIIPANIDETAHKGELPKDHALRLAIEKGRAVYKTNKPPENTFILSADTVVACGRRILPKTEDEQSARQCLALLSGRAHRVYGGLALIKPDGEVIARVVETRLHFKRLSAGEMDWYIQTQEWKGVAGGYAIQGAAAIFIKSINGSHSNVVGLSLYDTMQMLRGNGFPLAQI